MFLKIQQFTLVRLLQSALLFGSLALTLVTTTGKGATPADSQVRATSASKSSVSVECKYLQCGTKVDSGSVCNNCDAQLTSQAVNGMVKVGSSNRTMATNDMAKPNASFVYTLDNDVARNGVAVYRRGEDGSLAQLIGSPFNAGGKGLTGGRY